MQTTQKAARLISDVMFEVIKCLEEDFFYYYKTWIEKDARDAAFIMKSIMIIAHIVAIWMISS